ncbi:MAG TPA: hypothetical protein VMU10_12670 [Desulfomonilia bacterium]|nr:hypothetical protein [Desulfomonilia bacterium]
MMRLLKPVNMADSARIIRICAQWLKEGLGLKIVEYRIGNAFTGSIDILAANTENVYLVTINNDRLSDALLCALTGYRWYLENRDFLARIYQTHEIDLSLPPLLMILSPSFPSEIGSILKLGLKADVRLFKYLILGSEEDPDIYVEELFTSRLHEDAPATGFSDLKKELRIEEADLTDEEIGEFLTAMRV